MADLLGAQFQRYANAHGLEFSELATQLGTTLGVLNRLMTMELPQTGSELRRLAALFRIEADRLAKVLER